MEQQLPDYDTGIDQLETFLHYEAAIELDAGEAAVQSLKGQLWRPQNGEGDTIDLVKDGRALNNGITELYGPNHSAPLDMLAQVLPGSFVVASLTPKMSMPAIIATANQQTSAALTFYMVQKPWRHSGLTKDQEILLAATAQLETPVAGAHTNSGQTAGEAQHLLTQFGISNNPGLQAQWQQGIHVNHSEAFQNQGTLPSVSETLLPNNRILIGRIRRGAHGMTELSLNGSPYKPAPGFSLRWHAESMENDSEQGVKVGDNATALMIVQGAGFLAIKDNLEAVRQTLTV